MRVLPYPTLLFLDTGLFISCTDLAPCGRLQHPTGRRSRACLPRPGSFRSSWDSAELLCPELVGDSSLTRCPSPCKAQGALCRTGSAPMSHVWIHAQSPRELVPKPLCQNEEAALPKTKPATLRGPIRRPSDIKACVGTVGGPAFKRDGSPEPLGELLQPLSPEVQVLAAVRSGMGWGWAGDRL